MTPFDTETAKILRGLRSPPLACITWGNGNISTDGREFLDRYLGTPLVGHNGAFDMAVLGAQYPEYLPRIFQAYDNDTITDTMVREQLRDVASGRFKGYLQDGKWVKPKYNLGAVAERYGVKGINKEDPYRLRYGDYIGLPLSQWPPGAIKYATRDASGTGEIADAQGPITDEYRQTRYAFQTTLWSAWGIRTERSRVDQYAARLRAKQQDLFMQLVYTKLIHPSGRKHTAMVKRRMEDLGCVRLTEEGEIAIDAEACRASGDPDLCLFADYSVVSASINRDIPMLMAGTEVPVQARFKMVASGRYGTSAPNISNLDTGEQGVDLGVRECFVPRPGKVFFQADYEGHELRTLAQVCYSKFGFSKLRDMLNGGIDPLSYFASMSSGVSYEDICTKKEHKPLRQAAKPNLYGRPGGLGDDSFIKLAKDNYGVTLDVKEAKRQKQIWLDTFPEMALYFEHINSLQYDEKLYRYVAHGSNRVRGGCTYNSACNGYFQSLGADVSMLAGWLITRECYTPGTVLYGSRVIMSTYDEFLGECDEEIGHEVAHRVEELMVKAADYLMPDVKSKAPPTLQRYYSKRATAVWENGRLMPWG